MPKMHPEEIDDRSTMEIFEFTQRFIGQVSGEFRQLAILPADFDLHREKPMLWNLTSQEEVEKIRNSPDDMG